MDPVTERILERARERQKKLQGLTDTNTTNDQLKTTSEPNLMESKSVNRKDIVSDPIITSKATLFTDNCNDNKINETEQSGNKFKFNRQNSKTRISSETIGSPKQNLKTFNIQKDNFNMEIKVSSSDNIHLQVEIEEEKDDADDNDNGGLREEAKNKLKKLGKLYAGGDDVNISSPIYRTENKFVVEDDSKTRNLSSNIKSGKGLGRLADLAKNINEWEDEISKPKSGCINKISSPKKSVKPQAPQPPITKNSPTKPVWKKYQAPAPPKTEPPESTEKVSNQFNAKNSEDTSENSTNKLKWDPVVISSLEKQGYQRTTSNSHLVFNYKNSQLESTSKQSPVKGSYSKQNENKIESKLRSPVKGRGVEVASKAALFETSPTKTTKDPALMSVSERKALFEKNKGDALVPKAAFAMSIPIKTNIKNDSKQYEKNNPVIKKDKENKIDVSKIFSKKTTAVVSENKDLSPSKLAAQSSGIASKMAALLESKTTISQEQIENKAKQERQKDINLLLNRFNKNKEIIKHQSDDTSSSDEELETTETTAMINAAKSTKITPPQPPPLPSSSGENKRQSGKRTSDCDSPNVIAVLDEVKRIKVSPQKVGRLYPCLSDIETATETESEQPDTPISNNSFEEDANEDVNTSFGRDILKAVCKNQTPQKRPIFDESTASDMSDVLDDMDDYLDEAMAYDSNSSAGPTPSKVGRKTPPNAVQPSNSFSYKGFSTSTEKNSPKFKSPKKSPFKNASAPPAIINEEELPTHVVDGDNILPLTHTVSFYRRQQNQSSKTPVKQVIRQPIIEEGEQENFNQEIVKKKINELQDEVNKQQMIIAQTSRALNLCNSTFEFMGSTEQVEAEKVLLLATHRRLAALHEIQRLKVEETLRPQNQHSQNVPLEKGTLVISDIVLPLKKEYVRALAAAGGKGHHVVCLIKSDEQVIPTKLVSTVASSNKKLDTELIIPGTVKLNNIYSDFTVTFEVYCLQAHEEILPHDLKYHINNKKASSKLTPKKQKTDSRLIGPLKESPAGPQVVRTSSFALMGYAILSVQAVNRSQWTLNKAPSMSPLEGTVEMKVACELEISVEQRGFLTMFEDVSGFGAWHRRWCQLKGDVLSYWKYPDDEKKMPPIDTIDLKSCITKEAGPVSREICARLNTMLLERERKAYNDDKNSLTTICKGDRTVIRHLLSADTKEERIEWCKKLNAALKALRMWGNL